jgi:Domain of unknown function (DUF4266)
MHAKSFARIIALLTLACAIGGCATTPVQPWERARLARWDMRWDPDPAQAALSQHAYFSKEGSNGSIGAAGGGCGCN